MILNLFAIRDDKANAYLAPFAMPTQGQALRAFSDLTNDSQSTIYKHPEDYRLYLLGTFDDDTGTLNQTAGDHPRYLATASDFTSIKATPLSLAKKEA